MAKPLITADRVSYAYEGMETPAVSDLSLSVAEGEFLTILGRNGSGKSTLAKLFNALFLPTEGDVHVLGMNTKDPERLLAIRQSAGMVFQNPDNQLVATVVEEDVAFGLENIGVPSEQIMPRVSEALAAVNMTKFAKHAPHMLSGGQKQRVAIAGMLAMRSKILIFDEATAMLDPAGRRDVFSMVKRLNQENGITVIWITHFMEEAAESGRLIILDEGRAALSGTPDELFVDVQTVRDLGLDVPPIAALAHDLREGGLPLPAGILSQEELLEALCRL